MLYNSSVFECVEQEINEHIERGQQVGVSTCNVDPVLTPDMKILGVRHVAFQADGEGKMAFKSAC